MDRIIEEYNGSEISFYNERIRTKGGYDLSLTTFSGKGGEYNNITITDQNIYSTTSGKTHEIRTLSVDLGLEELEELGNSLLDLAKKIKEEKQKKQAD